MTLVSSAQPPLPAPDSILVIEVMGCLLGIAPKNGTDISIVLSNDVDIDLLHSICTHQNIAYPLIWLHTLVQKQHASLPTHTAQNGWIVLCRAAERHYALVVDAICGHEQLERMPMPRIWQCVPFYIAVAINAANKPLFICDPDTLAIVSLSLDKDANEIDVTSTTDSANKKTELLILQGWNTTKLYGIPYHLVAQLVHADDVTPQNTIACLNLPGDVPPALRSGAFVILTGTNGQQALHVQHAYDAHELPFSLATQEVTPLNIPALLAIDTQISTLSSAIMLVEGSSFFRKHIPPALAAAGYQVQTAATVPEAMRKLKQAPTMPTILIDRQMGEDFLCHYQAWEQHEQSQIIVLTTNPQDSLMHHFAEHGYQGCVSKTHVAGLLAAIRKLVRQEQAL